MQMIKHFFISSIAGLLACVKKLSGLLYSVAVILKCNFMTILKKIGKLCYIFHR